MNSDDKDLLEFQRDIIKYSIFEKETECFKTADIHILESFHQAKLKEMEDSLKQRAKKFSFRNIENNYSIGIATKYADTKKEYTDTIFSNSLLIPAVVYRLYQIEPGMKDMMILIGSSDEKSDAFLPIKEIHLDFSELVFNSGSVGVYFHYVNDQKLIAEIFDEDKYVFSEEIDLPENEREKNSSEKSRDAASQKKYPDIIENEFNKAGIFGMEMVKDELAKFYRQLQNDKIRGTDTASKKGYNFVLTGNPGTGKTTVARVIGKILYSMGLLPSPEMTEADRSTLVGSYIGHTAEKTKAVIDKVRKEGGTLFIDEAYELYKNSEKDFGEEAITTLLKDMEDHRGEYSVIIAGYKDKIEYMMENANPGFKSRFQYHINIPDYSDDELISAADKMLEKDNCYLSDKAKKALYLAIARERVGDAFANIRTVRNLISSARERMDERISEIKEKGMEVKLEDYYILTEKDFGIDVAEESKDELQKYLDTLDSLIGLYDAKNSVHEIINTVRINKLRVERGLSNSMDVGTMHLVFKGNAGTGKTTVARLMGDIYRSLGVLKRDKFVEVSASDLIQPYLGQSATKTRECIKSALGGVLFIDEAYILGNNDTYSREALNALIADIENYRKDLMVIVAGYGREMDNFLDANQGLRSRFSNELYFDDYSDEELLQIAIRTISSNHYILEEGNDDALMNLIHVKRVNSRDFGNARGVRNIVELLQKSVSNRVVRMIDAGNRISDDEIVTIRREDIESCL